MNLLKRIQFYQFKRKCNAVIEGGWSDDWRRFSYFTIPLKIPKKTGIIDDGLYKYLFYGVTDNFEQIQRINEQQKLELKLKGSLGSSNPVIVLKDTGGLVFYKGRDIYVVVYNPERPRTICLKDRRIFVDERMMKDQAYLKWLPEIIGTSKKIFDCN